MNGDPLDEWLADTEEGDQPKPRDLWDEDPPPRPAARRRLLIALAVVPWVVVALLLGRGGAAPPAPTGSPDPAGTPEPVGATHPRGAAGAAAPATPPAPIGSRAEVSTQALAVAALRSHETGAVGATVRYVDLAVAEGVEHVGDLAVVRVLAVVLEGDAQGYDTARALRYAVPVTADGRGVLGPPWPVGEVDVAAPAGPAPAGDVPAAGVVEALDAAGYTQIEVHGAGTHPDLPGVVVADVVAVAPGDAAPRERRVLLADGARLTLLGAEDPR